MENAGTSCDSHQLRPYSTFLTWNLYPLPSLSTLHHSHHSETRSTLLCQDLDPLFSVRTLIYSSHPRSFIHSFLPGPCLAIFTHYCSLIVEDLAWFTSLWFFFPFLICRGWFLWQTVQQHSSRDLRPCRCKEGFAVAVGWRRWQVSQRNEDQRLGTKIDRLQI